MVRALLAKFFEAFPKVALVGRKKFREPVFDTLRTSLIDPVVNCGWLKRLNDCATKCTAKRSPILKCLIAEISKLLIEGVWRRHGWSRHMHRTRP